MRKKRLNRRIKCVISETKATAKLETYNNTEFPQRAPGLAVVIAFIKNCKFDITTNNCISTQACRHCKNRILHNRCQTVTGSIFEGQLSRL